MKIPKPLTVLGKLRAARKELDKLNNLLHAKDRDIDRLNTRLAEARRRTIPYGGDGSSVNLLPICIKTIDASTELITVRSDSGHEERIPGAARCIVTMEADMYEGLQITQFAAPKQR
jgi:hypothetical protein